jgi:hypothetical protein
MTRRYGQMRMLGTTLRVTRYMGRDVPTSKRTQEVEDLIRQYVSGKTPDCLKEYTPPEITAEISEALKRVAPNDTPFYLEVTPLPECQPLRCYGNVEQQVLAKGGRSIEGWMVFAGWEGRYLVLIHHAVWEQSDGILVDPTPRSWAADRIRV